MQIIPAEAGWCFSFVRSEKFRDRALSYTMTVCLDILPNLLVVMILTFEE
jgi:hypothetical protein